MSGPQDRAAAGDGPGAPGTPDGAAEATDATDADATDAPDAPDGQGPGPAVVAGGPSGRAHRRRRLLRRAALLAVPLVLAVACAVLLQRVQAADTVAGYYRPSSAPLEAARTASRTLFSYDHRRLEQDFAAGAALSTGEFREEYSRTTEAVVRDVAERYQAVVQAEPVVAGVASAEPGRVTTVVFLNQTTTSTETDGQEIDQSRVRMTLVERDGEWLVSAVEAL